MSQVSAGRQPVVVPKSIDSRKLAVWLFLGSEVIFFTALIGGSLVFRVLNSAEWPHPGEILNVILTSINTFILICSSLTVVNGLAAIERGNQRGLKMWMLATLALGATFLGIQMYEYIHLAAEGLTFGGCAVVHAEHCPPIYAMTFYIQTGFHGFHVFIGLVWGIVVAVLAFRGVFTQHDHYGVEVFGLYWHFVDLVWILLFTIVYLI